MRRFRYVCGIVVLSFAVSVARPGDVYYEYDTAGRLRKVSYPQGMLKEYTIDAAGNRVQLSSQLDTVAPSAPTNLNASASTSTNSTVTWSAATDNDRVTGYRLERCSGAGCGTFAEIAAPTTTTFPDTGLSGSTSYSYRVRAIDAATNLGAYSSVATVVTPDTIKPSTPTGLAGSAPTSSAVNLSWNAASDAGGSGLAGYRVYRNGGSYTTTSNTSYSDTAVSGTATYSYAVASYDGAGNESVTSAPISVTTPDTLAPTAPTITSSSLTGANTVSLAWSASTDSGGSGLAGYRVYRSCPGGVIATTTSLSHVDTTAGPPGATCSYSITAYDNATNESASSNVITFTLPAPPAAPAAIGGPTATTTPNFALSWTSVAGATSYEVWDTTGTPFLATTVASSPAVLSRPQCFVYKFRVKACNVAGCSGFSPQKQVRVDKPVSCI